MWLWRSIVALLQRPPEVSYSIKLNRLKLAFANAQDSDGGDPCNFYIYRCDVEARVAMRYKMSANGTLKEDIDTKDTEMPLHYPLDPSGESEWGLGWKDGGCGAVQ